jgi:hypothetical protein
MEERMSRQTERERLLREGRERRKRRFFFPRIKTIPSFALAFPGGSLLKGTTLDRGMRLDYGSDLDVQGTAPLTQLSASADLSPRAGVGVDVAYLLLTGSVTPGTDLIYHGTVFPAGERLKTRIHNLLCGGGFHYRFYSDPDATLWALAGSRYLLQRANLRRMVSGGRVVETLDAFFPFLGAAGAFPLGRGTWFEATVKLSFLWYGDEDYWQANNMLDVAFGLAFHLFPHGRLRLGYRYLHLAALRESGGVDEEAHLSFHALSVGLHIQFY